MSAPERTHMDLDGAWPHDAILSRIAEIDYLDCRRWGPILRFCAPEKQIELFYRQIAPRLAPFILFGSGDFHHLSALWLRRFEGPVNLVSFDNHPDWDRRPPRWACGSWISRALELPHLQSATVWGCGNFELEWPHRLFANRSGRLRVHPWAERLTPKAASRWNGMRREEWRGRFAQFARQMEGRRLYLTVDIDCLRAGDAATNWENGLFDAEDVAWALRTVRDHAEIIGGDLCGAVSPSAFSRTFQRFASAFDHPRLPSVAGEEAARRNLASLEAIWPALTGDLKAPARWQNGQSPGRAALAADN